MRYIRLLSWVAGAAWAMEPVKAQVILDVLIGRALRSDDTPWDDETQEERMEARAAARGRQQQPQEGVAVVPVTGVISPRVHDVNGISTGGGFSSEGFATAMRQLAADPSVSGIVLDVDSPGGNVAGITEAVAAIRDAAAIKPVTAVANHTAASAAYWLSSAASEIVVTPSGEVGAIGVYAYHEDISQKLEAAGIKPTLIKAGPNKGEGHPAFPLSEEAIAYAQARVDDYYRSFVGDVAKGRNVSVSTVREQFGGGRMIGAKEAVRLGMADRVDTLEATIRRMQKSAGRASRQSASIATHRRRLAVA